LGFFFGTLKVQGEEPLQKLFVAQIGRPAVGGGDGGVEFLVGEVKPGGALVVEVREGARFQLGGAIGVTGFEAGLTTDGHRYGGAKPGPNLAAWQQLRLRDVYLHPSGVGLNC
jgi:hypothetical protein